MTDTYYVQISLSVEINLEDFLRIGSKIVSAIQMCPLCKVVSAVQGGVRYARWCPLCKVVSAMQGHLLPPPPPPPPRVQRALTSRIHL